MDVITLTGGALERVWFMPEQGPAGRALLIETTGGPKRYRRVWLDLPTTEPADWTWHRPADAVLIAGEPEE